jgi:hypothetical protein
MLLLGQLRVFNGAEQGGWMEVVEMKDEAALRKPYGYGK